ncbi:DUF2510 domain-containing protein, partial [Streptomyces sp. NPDC059013]|uniref:DUF2510 domain-containing protein n=1 Tax=Streptomyces sp. NPDC059013 TaxID=3346697 RepID=UPI003689400E
MGRPDEHDDRSPYACRPGGPPGRYPDPGTPTRERRWDGRAWTGHTRTPVPAAAGHRTGRHRARAARRRDRARRGTGNGATAAPHGRSGPGGRDRHRRRPPRQRRRTDGAAARGGAAPTGRPPPPGHGRGGTPAAAPNNR